MNKPFIHFLKTICLFIPLLAVISSCSSDFDPNADYKEIPVIYTVLDPTETTHFVRVNKAFLNTGTNALTIAANNPDSTLYDDVTVELLKIKNDRDSLVVQSHTLVKTVITDKEPGDFSYPEQELYKIEGVTLDPAFLYRIKITNNKSGLVAYGTTSILSPYCVTRVGNSPFSCSDTGATQEFRPEIPSGIRYYTSQNAGIYKVTAYFTFTELLDGNAVTKTVKWDISSNELRNFNSQTYEQIAIDKDAFYKQLVTLLQPANDPPTLRRVAGPLKYVVTAGSSELATYYLVNNSFSVFSQTLPEYDNIVNGTGLVASRRKVVIDAFISNKSQDSVAKYFPQLKFQ